jgi:anaerobic magnesium-protoporphyrin IX monomethyl ester cyclase
VDVEQYRKLWKKSHGFFSMNIVTTRGCPFHCNWCAKPIYGQVYNSRSPENVVDEIKFLVQKYSPDHFWFCDDIFGLKPGWVNKFRNLIKEENLNIKFKCLSRADLLLKEDNIKSLAESGCDTVWIGAESGSQKILDAMEKGILINEIAEARYLLHKYKIKTGFFIQFGYTGETKEDIILTDRLINELDPDDIGISVSYPLPGTKFYSNVMSQMKSKHNWEKSDDFEMMFQGAFNTEYYRSLHKKIHKKFRTMKLLKSPVEHFSSLHKLPFYLSAWIYYSAKLFLLELKQNRINSHKPLIEAIN